MDVNHIYTATCLPNSIKIVQFHNQLMTPCLSRQTFQTLNCDL